MTKRERQKVFKRAARIIVERGKHVGPYENFKTLEVCAMGALNVAEFGEAFHMNKSGIADEFLYSGTAVDCGLGSWNDRLSTTVDDIASLFLSEAARRR